MENKNLKAKITIDDYRKKYNLKNNLLDLYIDINY
jgi:hypothetical protein